MLFGVAIWAWMGPTSAAGYYASYVVEFSLSIDNVFVFVLIFSYFAVPPKYQHQVLLWGVLGAIVFRVRKAPKTNARGGPARACAAPSAGP